MLRKFHILLLLNIRRKHTKTASTGPASFLRSASYNWPTSISHTCVNLVMSLSPATQHTQDQQIRPFHVGLLDIIRGNFRDFGRRRAPQFPKLSELFRAHWYRNFLIAPVFIELPRISTRRPEYSARRSSWNSPLFHNRNTFRSVLHRTNRAEWFEMRTDRTTKYVSLEH